MLCGRHSPELTQLLLLLRKERGTRKREKDEGEGRDEGRKELLLGRATQN